MHARTRRRAPAAALLTIALLALIGCEPLPAGNEPGLPAPTRTATPALPAPGGTAGFDFYVLVLSWSPDYCAGSGQGDSQQCSLEKRLGFVLHGLWPQYEKGYPSNCSNETMPADVKAEFPNLYPSPALYDHEWEKHGTCSGLTPEQYLALSLALKTSVAIPAAYRSPAQPFRTTAADLADRFAGSNAGLSTDALAVMCSGSGRFLSALYVCYTVDGAPRPCSAQIRKSAASSCGSTFLVRNVR